MKQNGRSERVFMICHASGKDRDLAKLLKLDKISAIIILNDTMVFCKNEGINKMLSSELIELANRVCKQKSEEQTIELKAAHNGTPKRLYDTLSSFSNQDSGGIIIFGIDEQQDYAKVGVYDLQDLQKKVTEQCNQMEPPVRALFTVAETDGVQICSAEIPGIDLSERPCYYKGAGRLKGSCIRVGDADLPMTEYELYSFEAFRKHLHDDERSVVHATLKSLDEEAVEKYIALKKQERPGFAKLPETQVYEMLNIMRGNEPTLAAIMNFGIYPQGYFPQLCITAIVVPGTEIGDIDDQNARFLDNRRIEGTIPSMVEEALLFCRRNMKIQTVIDPDTGRRTDRTEYPVDAIREAVLNALIHRDYSIYTEGTPVQIDFFADRLEIHSPGTLYGRMSIEQLGIARPDQRNPALAVMTEVLTSAENRYSGIPTMRRTMKEYHLPAPKFENRRDEFVVTFYNGTIIEENNVKRRMKPEDARTSNKDLLAFCRTPRSRQEIAEHLNIKTVFYVMAKYVQPLIDAGKLGMTIPDKPKSRNQKYYTIAEER
ncbi:MAG: ATP-binding protein [Bilifractor sp.]|jgi:ATP-dependent DNA helicase RecG